MAMVSIVFLGHWYDNADNPSNEIVNVFATPELAEEYVNRCNTGYGYTLEDLRYGEGYFFADYDILEET